MVYDITLSDADIALLLTAAGFRIQELQRTRNNWKAWSVRHACEREIDNLRGVIHTVTEQVESQG